MNGKGELVEYRVFIKKAFKCGVCEHFTDGTFCMFAGHHVSSNMPAHKCKHFVFNEQKIKEK